jgi:hypothetical protein
MKWNNILLLTLYLSSTGACLKGQCHEIFRLQFFHQTTTPGPNKIPRQDFEFIQIFVQLFILIVDSPVMKILGSQLKSLKSGNFFKYESHVPIYVFKVTYSKFLE